MVHKVSLVQLVLLVLPESYLFQRVGIIKILKIILEHLEKYIMDLDLI